MIHDKEQLENLLLNYVVVIVVAISEEGTSSMSQALKLYLNGHFIHVADVSTGRTSYPTPIGVFNDVYGLIPQRYSSQFDKTIRNEIVFRQCRAGIYGREDIKSLGRRSTMGGIATSLEDSEIIFKAVRDNLESTVVVVYLDRWTREKIYASWACESGAYSMTNDRLHFLRRTDQPRTHKYGPSKIGYWHTIGRRISTSFVRENLSWKNFTCVILTFKFGQLVILPSKVFATTRSGFT